MKKKVELKKLKLNKERIMTLRHQDLSKVLGGNDYLKPGDNGDASNFGVRCGGVRTNQ